MLADRALWKKWAAGDKVKAAGWVPLPQAPIVKEVIPTSRQTPVNWRYTTEKPADNWMTPAFDNVGWKEGPAGFGTAGTPGAIVHTIWNTGDIWLRRTFTMPDGNFKNLQFYVYHDEDVDIYVNGDLAASESGFTTGYQPLEIAPAALKQLQPGAKIILAAHCHQTVGGQNIDVGLVNVTEH